MIDVFLLSGSVLATPRPPEPGHHARAPSSSTGCRLRGARRFCLFSKNRHERAGGGLCGGPRAGRRRRSRGFVTFPRGHRPIRARASGRSPTGIGSFALGHRPVRARRHQVRGRASGRSRPASSGSRTASGRSRLAASGSRTSIGSLTPGVVRFAREHPPVHGRASPVRARAPRRSVTSIVTFAGRSLDLAPDPEPGRHRADPGSRAGDATSAHERGVAGRERGHVPPRTPLTPPRASLPRGPSPAPSPSSPAPPARSSRPARGATRPPRRRPPRFRDRRRPAPRQSRG